VVILIGIHLERETRLTQMILTGCRMRGCLGGGQRWKQQAGKNADNRDHNQQFDERKCA